MRKAWVLTGDGINCEIETAEACRHAGFATETIHLSELVARPRSLDECSLLVLPGGFSFGDELGSGRVLAMKVRYQLRWDLQEFARMGGLVLGICNGFQALVALGIFGERVALAPNKDGRFRNEWTRLRFDTLATEKSPFLSELSEIELPIRHGEGRLLWENEIHPALRYLSDPNGSTDRVAGLLDSTGRILGLMPHPEGYLRTSQHPEFFRRGGDPLADGDGLAIFRNAFLSARLLKKHPQEAAL